MTDNNLRTLRVDENMTVPQAIASLSEFMDAQDIFICGYAKDGTYFSRSSSATRAELLWLLEDARGDVRGEYD